MPASKKVVFYSANRSGGTLSNPRFLITDELRKIDGVKISKVVIPFTWTTPNPYITFAVPVYQLGVILSGGITGSCVSVLTPTSTAATVITNFQNTFSTLANSNGYASGQINWSGALPTAQTVVFSQGAGNTAAINGQCLDTFSAAFFGVPVNTSFTIKPASVFPYTISTTANITVPGPLTSAQVGGTIFQGYNLTYTIPQTYQTTPTAVATGVTTYLSSTVQPVSLQTATLTYNSTSNTFTFAQTANVTTGSTTYFSFGGYEIANYFGFNTLGPFLLSQPSSNAPSTTTTQVPQTSAPPFIFVGSTICQMFERNSVRVPPFAPNNYLDTIPVNITSGNTLVFISPYDDDMPKVNSYQIQDVEFAFYSPNGTQLTLLSDFMIELNVDCCNCPEGTKRKRLEERLLQ